MHVKNLFLFLKYQEMHTGILLLKNSIENGIKYKLDTQIFSLNAIYATARARVQMRGNKCVLPSNTPYISANRNNA